MKTETISVTDAVRNFSDCLNRVRYQGTSFVLVKNGVAVARIVPEECKPTTGREIAAALREALHGVRLSREEADAWLQDLEEARQNLKTQTDKWQS